MSDLSRREATELREEMIIDRDISAANCEPDYNTEYIKEVYMFSLSRLMENQETRGRYKDVRVQLSDLLNAT